MIGVAHLDAHHLVASTDSQHRSPVSMSLDDSLGTSVTTQFVEIMKCGFSTRKDDNICLADIIDVVGIEEMYARVLFQRIEVGIVGEVLQHNDSDIHLALLHYE